MRAGRGIVGLRVYPSLIESDLHVAAFLEACLHDGAYDAQCEPKRAPWLVELLARGGLAETLAKNLATALPHVPDDGADLPHVLAVLVGVARLGEQPARDAVIAELALPRTRNRLALARAAVAIDGLGRIGDALRYLARSEPDTVAWKDVADWYGELAAEQGVDALERAWRDDANLDPEAERVWQDARELWRAEQSQATEDAGALDTRADEARHAQFQRLHAVRVRAIGAKSFDELDWTPRERQADPEPFVWPAQRDARAWGRYAADAEIERAYAALLDERDVTRLELLYAVFAFRTLPRLDARLLAHLEHAEPRVVEAAADALGRVRDDRVHAAALRRLTANLGDLDAFRLLRQNWRVGDAARVLDALPADPDDDTAHFLASEIADHGPAPDDPRGGELLTWVYDHSPCAFERATAVKKLAQRGPLPEWMREELAWDVDHELRAFAALANAPLDCEPPRSD